MKRLFSERACGIWAIALSLAAVAHRLLLAAHQFILATDTGTLALMALDILRGERPLFLYGFSYSGAPLAYLTALAFRLFGVSLAPLVPPTALLAGLWVWLSWRLFQRLAGPRAGLAAALLYAFPDRLTSWYAHTPDSSYGGFLALGTLILWLAVEIEARDLRGGRLAAWMALLGTAGGLAFWTNALIAPYLLAAGIPLLVHFRRHRFHPRLLAAGLAGACGFLLAASPVLVLAIRRTAHAETLDWRLDGAWIAASYRIMVTEGLPNFFEWITDGHRAVLMASWLFVAAGVATGLWTWARAWRHAPRWRAALPPALMALFLAGYLPHTMAHLSAARYLLPFWTMFLACAAVVPMGSASRRLRVAAGLLLAVWVGWNIHGSVALSRLAAPDRAARLARRATLAATVGKLGAHHATLLGDYYFQTEANGLSFLARGRPGFVGAGKERDLPAAQAAEREPVRIYLCQQSTLSAAQDSLRALGAAWRETPIDATVTLLHDLRPPPRARQPVPLGSATVTPGPGLTGVPAHLTDNSQRTVVQGDRDRRSSFTLDLGRERNLCGLELIPADASSLTLPTHGSVALSTDGAVFRTVVPWKGRLPVAYAAGDGVYLGGGQGRLEFSFPPRPARYVRFTGASPAGRLLDIPRSEAYRGPDEWMVSEVRVYESAAAWPAATDREVRELAAYLDELGVWFTACDRWLAPRLLARQPADATPCAFPLFERPGHLQGDGGEAPFWRFRPAPGTALVVAAELADEQAARLRQALGRGEPWYFSEHGAYASFVFLPTLPPEPPSLVWDGAMLIFE